jgi:hypothetical protein
MSYAQDIQTRINRQGDAGQVINTIQQVYQQIERVRELTARFASDPDFDEMTMNLLYLNGFDGEAIVSQMMYDINQLRTAWLANPNYRKILGLPDL